MFKRFFLLKLKAISVFRFWKDFFYKIEGESTRPPSFGLPSGSSDSHTLTSARSARVLNRFFNNRSLYTSYKNESITHINYFHIL